MSDDHDRAVLGAQHLDTVEHMRLAGRVQVRGRLIQHDQRGVRHERPGQTQTLALPDGQPGASLADPRLPAVGERRDHLVETRGSGGSVERGENPSEPAARDPCELGCAVGADDVVQHRARHDHRALGNPGDLGPPCGRLDL